MSYTIAQIRKDANYAYMSDLAFIPSTVQSPNTFGATTPFTDYCLKPASGTFQRGNVYYLRAQIMKIPAWYYSGQSNSRDEDDLLRIIFCLKNQDTALNETDNQPQNIATITVPKTEDSVTPQYYACSMIFVPLQDFDLLAFKVVRSYFDAVNGGLDNLSARQWLLDTVSEDTVVTRNLGENSSVNINIFNTTRFPRIIVDDNEFRDDTLKNNNIDGELSILNSIVPNGQEWLKFGYQSRPGSLITVNKQPIILGRSGIYEINNGTKITDFRIACPRGTRGSNNENIDAFLLDYAYDS